MGPTRLFPIIALISLLTVEVGGGALLGYLTGRGSLTDFQERFFRAGHAHAGVLLILALAYYAYFDRANLSETMQWIAGGVLAVGILAQSGGFFLHMLVGEPDAASIGTQVTRGGGILIAVALIMLVVGLIRA